MRNFKYAWQQCGADYLKMLPNFLKKMRTTGTSETPGFSL